MKKKHLSVCLALAFIASSCKNELPQDENVINIEASITSQSRAPQLGSDGSGSFSDGDVMSLFISNTENSTVALDYEYGTGFITWNSIGFEEQFPSVMVAACYPKQSSIQNGDFEFNALTSSYPDLLLAPQQSVVVGASETVYLTFSHAMHKLDLSFTLGNGYADEDISSLSLAINAKTTCVIDGVKGKIKELKDEVGVYSSTGESASFYLVPQATSGVVLNINIDGDSKTVSLDELLSQLGKSQEEILGGKYTSLSLKISRNGITVEGGSIGGWENQVTADGEIVVG